MSGTPAPASDGLHILLVEDDPDDVVLCRDAIIRSDLQCDLRTAGSLRDAMARMDADGADVALVDLSLPDAQQLEAVTALGQRFTQLPIVVLTGLHDERHAAAALHAGAEDYLVKGRSSPETIGRAVRYAIERKRGEQARRAKDTAEAANQAKNEFISRMSHELRTPLTAILGFAQILEGECTDEQRDFARHILTAGRHLLGLISGVLDLARVDAGELDLSIQPVPLADVVNEAVALIRPLAADRQVTVRTNLVDAAHLRVLADPQRLSQVLLNLLSNAVKYNNLGGDVEVGCSLADGRAKVDVRDTGIGLNPEQLTRLFTPFNRLGAEHGGIEGTGLGLAITKHLAEAMGATIGVDSVEGEGTTVWTAWPVAPRGGTEPQPTPPEQRETRPPLRATVLYIEDNDVNIALVERIMAGQPGVRLVTATTAAGGIDLAMRYRPDVILLDLNLPDLPAERTLATFRSGPDTCDTPVIVVTADATPASRDQMRRTGIFAYVTKPFQVDELLDTIASALRLTARY